MGGGTPRALSQELLLLGDYVLCGVAGKEAETNPPSESVAPEPPINVLCRYCKWRTKQLDGHVLGSTCSHLNVSFCSAFILASAIVTEETPNPPSKSVGS